MAPWQERGAGWDGTVPPQRHDHALKGSPGGECGCPQQAYCGTAPVAVRRRGRPCPGRGAAMACNRACCCRGGPGPGPGRGTISGRVTTPRCCWTPQTGKCWSTVSGTEHHVLAEALPSCSGSPGAVERAAGVRAVAGAGCARRHASATTRRCCGLRVCGRHQQWICGAVPASTSGLGCCRATGRR